VPVNLQPSLARDHSLTVLVLVSKDWSITSCKKQRRCQHNHRARLLMMRSVHLTVTSQTVHLHRRSPIVSYTKTTSALVAQQLSQCPCVVHYRHTSRQHLRPQTLVKTVINNDQFKCQFYVLCATYLCPCGAHL